MKELLSSLREGIAARDLLIKDLKDQIVALKKRISRQKGRALASKTLLQEWADETKELKDRLDERDMIIELLKRKQ